MRHPNRNQFVNDVADELHAEEFTEKWEKTEWPWESWQMLNDKIYEKAVEHFTKPMQSNEKDKEHEKLRKEYAKKRWKIKESFLRRTLTVFEAWGAVTKLRKFSKLITKSKQDQRRERNEQLDIEITEAAMEGNYAQVWHLAKLRTGKKLGAKIRGKMSQQQLTQEDWHQGLKREGKDGGCKATPVEWEQWHADVKHHLANGPPHAAESGGSLDTGHQTDSAPRKESRDGLNSQATDKTISGEKVKKAGSRG